MFYILSKLLSFLLLPVGIILVLMLYILIHKNRTNVKKATYALITIFYITSCPWLVDQAIIRYEIPARPLAAYPDHTLGILLTGGITNEGQTNSSRVHLGVSGDRLWQTLFLYQNKKIQKILVSGFDGSFSEKGKIYEVDLCKSFLVQNGVKAEDIFLEKKARNTRENATYSKEIIDKNFPGASLLLITSAYHLRRASACFLKTGLAPDLYGTSYLSNHFHFKAQHFIPSSTAFFKSGILIKEWVGYLAYRTAGYI